jgi:hypothetical protein
MVLTINCNVHFLCLALQAASVINYTMLPPRNDPDYEERLVLLSNIRAKWDPRTKDSSIVPKAMRHNDNISTWPLPVLRAISKLANDMPGDDEWNNVYDLLVEGHKKRIKDKSNSLPAQLQLSDITYVRQKAGLDEPAGTEEGKGKDKMIDKNEEAGCIYIFCQVLACRRLTDMRRDRICYRRKR